MKRLLLPLALMIAGTSQAQQIDDFDYFSANRMMIGMLVDEGRLALDTPLGFEWLPAVGNPENDPCNAITLRHVLNMSSGLYPIDSFGMEYATGSGLAYWAGASSVDAKTHR